MSFGYTPTSPRFVPTCKVCGWRYEVSQVLDEGGEWIKHGAKLTDFHLPLSVPAQTLPLLQVPGVSIIVSWMPPEVRSEGVFLTVPLAQKQALIGRLHEWITAQGYSHSLLTVDLPPAIPGPANLFPAGRDPFAVETPQQSIEDGRATFSISVTTHADTQEALFFYHLDRRPPQATPMPAPP